MVVDRSNGVSGLAGMVAVAVVSTGVILASYYHLHRRLESDLKLNTTVDQRRPSRTDKTTKKKVRFADDMAAADHGDELRRASASTVGAGGSRLVRPALRSRRVAYSSTHLAC